MSSSESDSRKLAFLITAAGNGTRAGGLKKEFRLIGSRTVLSRTVDAFLDSSAFSYGVITCKPGTHDRVREALSDISDKLESLEKPLLFCDGGAERQESVYLGLQCLAGSLPELTDNGIVLIHDGARPWIEPELIQRIVDVCRKHSACAPVVPSVDAMKEINEQGIITGHHPRKETVSVQTPQGFSFNEILTAHSRAAADGRRYIDDTEIFSRYEGDVYTVEGNTNNRKITYSTDFGAET